ncbi:MAG: clostripain-related cysteine peptidase [Oscillospiraceae bacterium]|nr:clostripain-related cysteine peptidase [Oscillospiraceae bacterium]
MLFSGAWSLGSISGSNIATSRIQGRQIAALNEDAVDLSRMRFYREISKVDFSGVSFAPWDVASASANVQRRAQKPYTIMVYMNGSDLESKMGAGTADILQMQRAGVNPDNANIVIFTGGAHRWKNNVIPANNCVIWELSGGSLNRVAGIGLRNMGNPGTLSGFIDFTMENFPADKFGLIMWDHGGGSIAGFGDDEKFNHNNLTLLDLNYAFENSNLKKQKLEFLGFDSCLMATVEMAVIAADYAKYLIASVDIEPYEGWNYNFLSVLNEYPNIGGGALGKVIVDYFMHFYGNSPNESLALSVVDLSRVNEVMGSLGALMKQCSDTMLADREASFKRLAARRGGTKTFGIGSPRDNESDMVDIGDMATKLSDLFPRESAAVLKALDNCVVYNRHNSNVDLKGLSVYYIYGGKSVGNMSLNMYRSLHMNGDYTRYLNDFYGMLRLGSPAGRSRFGTLDEPVKTELAIWQPIDGKPGVYIMTGIQSGSGMNTGEIVKSGLSSMWPEINGKPVCMYQINRTSRSVLYAIPASLNGRDCDIIVSFCEESPRGRILGARQEDGLIIQKGYDDIVIGDEISFYYTSRDYSGGDIGWYKGAPFTVDGELKLSWDILNGEKYYSLQHTDVQQDKDFTELRPVALENIISA